MPFKNPISRVGTTDLTGTASGGDIGDTENSSGSLETLKTPGFYVPTEGGDTTIPDGGDGPTSGFEDLTGGGDTDTNNITKFLPTGTQSFGGAGIDPTGASSSGTTGLGTDGLTPTLGGGISGQVGVDGTPIMPEDGIGAGTGVGTGARTGVIETGQNNEVISVIHDIEIINTGTGYSPEDGVEIVGGNNGAELSIETSPTGQIVNINVVTGGYGFTSIPQIRINTVDGLGAKFRPILRFIPASQFTQRELNRIGTDNLLRVVDCVLK